MTPKNRSFMRLFLLGAFLLTAAALYVARANVHTTGLLL